MIFNFVRRKRVVTRAKLLVDRRWLDGFDNATAANLFLYAEFLGSYQRSARHVYDLVRLNLPEGPKVFQASELAKTGSSVSAAVINRSQPFSAVSQSDAGRD